ncbi:DegT/DnrJ/EryC1/StrS aminotransferase family protein [Maridesulfovibrio ferrireducens]|uniref:DegT/DnrJ/EryC1/StrS family aminotransferase n=1 Tax=Maridesulfovibrio ferrireducens TaxID=246191 RepID=UPI001A2842A7|nr:DegT/DnrJ/EryC1/StrS family aminotransferase [Maridesulfovibrio ferrireducens]MBI9113151.1 DegT/DnrJ/EryC1/StrS family aminotransferase [Maridesulfovibrio ferrireducens]
MPMNIPCAKPSITAREIAYVTDAVTNGWGAACYGYITKFKEYLSDFFDSPHVWPVSSCHGALHVALMALGVGSGDEVIVPDSTWVGSVFPITWTGATPVFVDVQKDTWCLDPAKIEASITPRTKAIIAVHLYGNMCDMSSIMSVAEKYGLPVIEDAAEAIGSKWGSQYAGTVADFGVFSLHGTKTLTSGEGGILLSNRDDLAVTVSAIESQGRKAGAKIFWVDELGLKYKMSNIDAALGLAQFERAEELIASKREVFGWYKEALASVPDITINVEPQNTTNGYWMPTVIFGTSWGMTIEKRDALIDAMNTKGLAIRPFFYPISLFPMYKSVPGNIVSYDLYKRGINLPSYLGLTRDQIRKIVLVLKLFLNNKACE